MRIEIYFFEPDSWGSDGGYGSGEGVVVPELAGVAERDVTF